ncbi:MAG: UDP-N-acetylmuramoyl-L-alanyl-D-glutamate--2,6-diaminopimelate ligase [Fusobacteriota bacterium]
MELFENIENEIINKGKKYNYKGMEYDSRKVTEGDIFIAVEGFKVDGHDYIESAIKNGAKMVIVSKEVKIKDKEVKYVKVKNTRKSMGEIASNFFEWPQNELKILGVTGTNGKTTTTYLLEEILGKVTRLGTIEYKVGDEVIPAPNTTPESLDIVKMCKKSLEKGIEYLVMEVSSHALELGRVSILDFDVAIFTNLSQDHLGFHGNMTNYFNAKKKLFEKLKDESNGVINIDDRWGEQLGLEYHRSITTSIDSTKKASVLGKILKYTNHDMILEIDYNGKNYKFETQLMGKFNLYNMISAFGGAIQLGLDPKNIIERLSKAKKVPGRFETINEGQDYMVVVDYAHTDDGLKNILSAVKELDPNRLITVFGAGGDRDTTKRPKMAKVAAKYSDFIILTSDNPRMEDPQNILNEVEEGLKEVELDKNKYEVILERKEAIEKGIDMAKSGDVLVIAGKGHETYQIIGDEKIHFDDREIARKTIKFKK